MIRILPGDCRDVLKTLADASVDSVVTDPPYHLTTGKKGGTGPASVNPRSPAGRALIGTGFMGMTWDGGDIAQDTALWAECLRVLKPGGYLLAFSGTRTYHRMACAIEDAGFEIRDQIGWAFGSGFPKSHNGAWGGTALKPAWEPICMARKPLIGTVEANWREHGTGALNIDGCRVATGDDLNGGAYTGGSKSKDDASSFYTGTNAGEFMQPVGRWPANLCHDGSDEVLAAFPAAPGQQGNITGDEPSSKTHEVFGGFVSRREFKARRDGEPSAARFFYTAKASRHDRNDGLHDMPQRVVSVWGGDQDDLSAGKKSTQPRGNHHPTVKPTELMRWLCRLVTPAGGLVLDPFMGSGSTLKAAELEGFCAIGIELDPQYIEIARRRIASDAPLFAEVTTA